MAKKKSTNRQKAYSIWSTMGGIHAQKGVLHHVAAVLNTSEELVRKWKCQDKWVQTYFRLHPQEYNFTEPTEEPTEQAPITQVQEKQTSTPQSQDVDIAGELKKMIIDCDTKSEKIMNIINKIEYQGDIQGKENEKVIDAYKAVLRGVDTITKVEKQKFTYLSSLEKIGEKPRNSNTVNLNNDNNNPAVKKNEHAFFYMPYSNHESKEYGHIGRYDYDGYTIIIYDAEKGYLGNEEIKEDEEENSYLVTN